MMKANAKKLEDTYLWEYYQAIKSGEIPACFEMKQELENLIEEYHDKKYRYDTTKAYIFIDFIENCIKHTKPPFYGKPFVLMLWEKTFLEVLFSFKIVSIDTGKWVQRFTECLLWIARKNGKTTFVAAIELASLFLSSNGSLIVCSGMNDNIADLCYTELNNMRVFIDPKQAITWKNQKGIRNKLNSCFIQKISESSRGKEGRNIIFAGIDEVWEMKDEDGIYFPLRQSASTQPEYLIALFSSDGTVVDGFADKKLKEYKKIIDRESSDVRKLPWIYKMDNEKECFQTDENGINRKWLKANPSLGEVKLYSSMKDLCEEARTKTETRLTFLTKDCNIKQGSVKAWLNPEHYNYDSSFNIEDFKGYIGVGAVDLAETTDLVSAKIYLFKRNSPKKYVISHYWIPKSKMSNSDDKKAGAKYEEWASQELMSIVDGNDVLDLGIVADWFYNIVIKYKINIFKIGYDQKFKTAFIKQCEYYGWVDKERLIMINQSADVLHTANNQIEADLREHLIVGLNEVDKWCLSNAGLKIDSSHKSLIIKQDRCHRIDGAVTLAMAQEMLNRCRNEILDMLPIEVVKNE